MERDTKRSVLILDGDQRSALATVRSLGARGLDVHVGATNGRGLALYSRHVNGRLDLPQPELDPGAYLRAIADYSASRGIGVLLPMAEVSSQVVLQGQQALGNVRLAMPPVDTFEAACDKALLARRGLELGVPVADYVVAAAGDQQPRGFECFGAPVVLKPVRSRVQHAGRWHATRVCVARSPADYVTLVQNEPGFALAPFIVQRFVPGSGAGVFFAYERGRCVASFAHRRLREKPPTGGVSVLSESIVPPQEHLEHGRRLLDALAWHGLAMVEFRVDGNGTPWLMEINPRFWGSLQLAIDAGVDFPWIAWQLANDMPVEPVGHYVAGRRLRWLLGDVDHLLIRLKAAATWSERLSALRTFVTPVGNTRHEVNRLADPMPAVYELGDWLRRLVPVRSDAP